MRGPLLSGPVGGAVTLGRLTAMLRDQGPTVVVRSAWLGLTLCAELSVLAVLPATARSAARRRRRKSQGLPPSLFVLGGAAAPLQPGTAGSIVVADLAEIDPPALVSFLIDLAALVRPGGIVVGVDRTKDAATEARLAGALLTAGFLGIGQERPREGALLTRASPPSPTVRAILASAVAASAVALSPPPPA